MPVDLAEWEPVAEEAKPKEADLSEWEGVPAAAPKPQFKDLSAAQPLSLRPDVGRIRPPEQMTTYGGPPKAVASLPETLAEPVEAWMNPRITTPKLTVNKDDNPAVAVGKEAVNIASSIPEFLSSNMGLASVVSGMVAPTATSAAFTVDMLKNVGEGIASAHKNWGSITPAQKWAAITDIGGNALMAMLTGKHAATGVLNEVVPARHVAKMLSESEFTPRPTGESLYELAQHSAQAKAASPATGTTLPVPADQAPKSIHPALLVNDQGLTGPGEHADIFKQHSATSEDPMAVFEAQADDSKHVFVDENGNVLRNAKGEPMSRFEAADLFKKMTGKDVAEPARGLQSRDLIDAGLHQDVKKEAPGEAPKPENIQPKPASPQPDWRVMVQGKQGEAPGWVQIVDPKATEQSQSPTVESLRGAGHEVPDFSKLPQGSYTWEEEVRLSKSAAPAAASAAEPAPEKLSKAQIKSASDEFKKLVQDYGIQRRWIPNPDALDVFSDVAGGHGTASIKAKIGNQTAAAEGLRKALKAIGLETSGTTQKELAVALPKLKAELAYELNPPRIPEGQAQGDLLTTTQKEPLALVGETSVDAERLAREKSAAEKSRAEAKAIDPSAARTAASIPAQPDRGPKSVGVCRVLPSALRRRRNRRVPLLPWSPAIRLPSSRR